MAITVEEKFGSPVSTSGQQASAELQYVVKGTDDDIAARAAVESTAPASYLGLAQTAIRIEPDGPELWTAEVSFGTLSFGAPQSGEPTFSFDTGGGTQHITQSRATVAAYAPAGATAPDFKGAIGVTADSVEGVDIVVPVFSFTETHVIADATVTDAYKRTLMLATGKVNTDTFRGFNPGEVLFMGAAGTKRGEAGGAGEWEITFRFAVSPNETGLSVGAITGIDKKGWEYLWVRYEDAEDGVASAIVKRPVAAYIERVYPETAFSALGL